MQGSRALRFAVVVILIFAAFMVGRSSVRPTEPSEPTETQRTMRPQKLSAITPAAQGRPGRSDRQGADRGSRPIDPSLAGNLDADLKTVSEFLSAAASTTGDLRAVSAIIADWMDHDPDGAIEWLASGEHHDEILTLMFKIWGQQNPNSALAWIEANRETDRYEHAAAGLAETLDSEQALELAETLVDPSRRAGVWIEAGIGLYAESPELALERLAAADFPDELESLTIQSWKRRIAHKSKRNAQNLASVFSAARAAGAEFQGGSTNEIIREIVGGVTGSGSFNTTRFQVPNLSDTEIELATRFLDFSDDRNLNYASVDDGDL